VSSLPPWANDPEPTEEEPAPRSAKEARRKREPRPKTRHGDYHEGPAGDKKCGARKQDGSRCGLAAGWKTDHPGYGPCAHHIGSTPIGRKVAAEEMGEELMAFYGTPVDTNPIEALLDEVSRTAGHIAWLGQRIGQFQVPIHLEEIDEQTGIQKLVVAGIPPEVEGWLRVYQSERAQLVRVSKAALDAGVNERLVQIAEHQGAKIADAIDVILNALELTAAQRARIPYVVPNVLRQLTSGPAVIEGVIEDGRV
jgi:hypothetical protein